MQSLSFRTVHTGFFLFLENISNPCNSGGGGGSFVSRMKRQNRVHTPAATHNKKRGYIIMKKTVSVCMTAVMALSLLASRTTGSGIQYRILCKATVVVPGAQEEYVVVTLQRGWLGKAEILDIGDPLCLTNLDYEEGAVGTWQEAESPAMTEEATAAFNKATEGFVGVDYVPVALLSTQTVAGTNYRILCEATTVYPGAEMHYAVVNVYESLEGNANIISVTDGYVS